MAHTAREVIDRFYEAERIYMAAPPGTADFAGLAATLSEHVKLYQSEDLSYGGVYEGIIR